MKSPLTLLLLLCVGCIAPALAQKDTTGWDRNSAYGRMYNPNTAVEIKGEIVAVERIAPIKGMSGGVHLLVKTGNGSVRVHLGPQWYIDRQNVRFNKGDKVKVAGSKVTIDAKEVVIARQLSKGAQLLILRDKNGVPLWSGGRNRK